MKLFWYIFYLLQSFVSLRGKFVDNLRDLVTSKFFESGYVPYSDYPSDEFTIFMSAVSAPS